DLAQRAPAVATPVLSSTESLSSTVHTGTVGLTQILAPEIGNEARANYSNHKVGTTFALDNFGGAVPPPDSLMFPAGVSSANGDFAFSIVGVGQLNQGPQGITEQRQVNLVDNLSLTRASHQLKFGVDYRWLAPLESPFAYRQASQFSGVT